MRHYHAAFLETWQGMGISFDLFTATDTENHTRVSQDLFRRLLANGYLYTATEDLFYDPVKDRFLRTATWKAPALIAATRRREATSAISAAASWRRTN